MLDRFGKPAICGVMALSAALMLLQVAAIAQPDPPDSAEADSMESPLVVEPTTPEDQFSAALLMLRLGRPALARKYLQQVVEAQLSPEALLELRDEYGTAVFLRLARNRDLQPHSRQLLESVNEAFRGQATDPNRIDALVTDLTQDPRRRDAALAQLQNAGVLAVPRLIVNLENPEVRDMVVIALVRIGEPAVAPLIAALDSPDDTIRAAAINALGRIGSRDAVPFLWHAAFSETSLQGERLAARQALARILRGATAEPGEIQAYGVPDELKRSALEHFSGQHAWDVDETGTVPVWIWRADLSTVEMIRLPPEMASAYYAAKLARQALELAPQRQDLQALSLAASLALAIRKSGFDQPLPTGPGTVHDQALVAGAQAAADVLDVSLKNTNSAAILAAIRILGQTGTRHNVAAGTFDESPLTAALNYPDERIQMAAADAILQIDPDKRYAAADRVIEVLGRALTDGGVRRGIVIDASVERGSMIASFLSEMGFEVDFVRTGREGFQRATQLSGVGIILLHANSIRWGLTQTIANLRADARTASIPIVVYGSPESERAVRKLLLRYPLSSYMTESTTSEYFHLQLRAFLADLRTAPLTAEERTQMQAQALYRLASIASGKRREIYDLTPFEAQLSSLTANPELADNALLALSAVPTVSAQRTLQELAVTATTAPATRTAAAWQLAYHIQRQSLLLSSGEIDELESMWKSIEDPQLATALASVLGSIQAFDERPISRLPSLPAPTPPVP